MPRLFLLAAILCLAACAPARLAPAPARPLSARATLVFDDGFDELERQELAAELDFAERLYLGSQGGASPRVRLVRLHSSAFLPRQVVEAAGLRASRRARYLGLCRWGGRGAVIDLAVDLFGGIPAAAHELHHARIGDADHGAASWRAVDALRYAWR